EADRCFEDSQEERQEKEEERQEDHADRSARESNHDQSGMSTILLADDSPHAQRMGERILREEGFAVVSLTDGDTAMLRLDDVDPDLIIADVFLPGRNGFELCRHVKATRRHVRVILTAGL